MAHDDFVRRYGVWASVIAWMLASAFASVIWAVRMDARTTYLELNNTAQDSRIVNMDEHGTRRLLLIDEKQRDMAKRFEIQADRMNNIEKRLQIIKDGMRRKP